MQQPGPVLVHGHIGPVVEPIARIEIPRHAGSIMARDFQVQGKVPVAKDEAVICLLVQDIAAMVMQPLPIRTAILELGLGTRSSAVPAQPGADYESRVRV